MKDESHSAAFEQNNNPIRDLLSTSIGVALAVGAAPAAQAATLTVTSNADSGTGSLRDTVAAANAGDTIDFQPGLASPIVLTSGQIAFNKALTISGPGASALAIDAGGNSRIFYVHGLTNTDQVTISGLTLTTGHVVGSGAAVLSNGPNFTLQDSVVENSTVDPTSSSSPNGGGGVRAVGSGVILTVSGVTLQGNTSKGGGGGLYIASGTGGTSLVANSVISGNTSTDGWGGGLYITGETSQVTGSRVVNNQTLAKPGGGIQPCNGTNFTISDSVVSGNTSATNGGGLYICYEQLTMIRTVVSGNTAAGNGGGIGLYGSTAASSIQDSTISNNSAGVDGGGLEVLVSASDFATALTNVTIVGNAATGSGGGVYSNLGYIKAGPPGVIPLTIESSTITNNNAATGGGLFAATTGIPITLHNSIAANNTATTRDPDTSGAFTANFNFILDQGDATLNGGINNAGADPQLGSLGDYGGPTPTKRPLFGSPVVNAGDPTGAPSADQRGLPRPAAGGGTVDIGAVETQPGEDSIFLDGLEGY